MKALSFYIVFFLGSILCQGQELSYRVLFEYDKYDIPDSAMLRIVKMIDKQPIERVLLEGHCDSIGSKHYNYILSDNRAKEVQKLLVQNGIKKENIKKCIGYGKDKPVTDNGNEKDRQLNRRVLITFYLKEESRPIDSIAVVKPVKERKIPKPKYVEIEKAKVGDQIIFEKILFEPGRHILKPESLDELQTILDIMRKYPTLEIEIQGHVCCTTDEPDGFDWDLGTNNLSLTRAKEIYLFLRKSGIDKSRLQYEGYGGTRKINTDEFTEELRRVNRRVEIKILKR